MKLKSLGYRTDLIFPSFEGEIMDRGDYLVVRTPKNPIFYWGNFLLFSDPPRHGDFEGWRELFAREIGRPPAIKHQAFGWDGTLGQVGEVAAFTEAGFSLERNLVLAANEPRLPARSSTEAVVRPLSSTADWEQALELQVLCREPEHDEPGYRQYRVGAIERYQKMDRAGLGHWYAAFIDDEMVADLGVFHDQRGLGRYQSVETHPDFRRRGIAGKLIYNAGRHALAEYNLETLVIVAEDDSDPARLYRSLGFEPKERTAGLLWWEGKPQQSLGA